MDVCRDGTTLEEPDANCFISPFHGVDTTSHIVETIAISVVVAGGDLATFVVSLAGCVDITVVGPEAACEIAIVVDGTTVCRVQCHGIVVLCVHTFNDINFTTIGPVGSNHPEGRPCTTGVSGHMLQIEDNESAGVVSVLASQADTWTAIGLDVGMVDSDVDFVVRVTNQTSVPRCALVNILNKAVSGI